MGSKSASRLWPWKTPRANPWGSAARRSGGLSRHKATTYFGKNIETAIGLKRGDTTIEAVGGAPTRWKLLREGKIDAGLQPFH